MNGNLWLRLSRRDSTSLLEKFNFSKIRLLPAKVRKQRLLLRNLNPAQHQGGRRVLCPMLRIPRTTLRLAENVERKSGYTKDERKGRLITRCSLLSSRLISLS